MIMAMKVVVVGFVLEQETSKQADLKTTLEI
jgi:hypothetical protein